MMICARNEPEICVSYSPYMYVTFLFLKWLFHCLLGAEVYQVDIRYPIASREELVQQFREMLDLHENIKIALIGKTTTQLEILVYMHLVILHASDASIH